MSVGDDEALLLVYDPSRAYVVRSLTPVEGPYSVDSQLDDGGAHFVKDFLPVHHSVA